MTMRNNGKQIMNARKLYSYHNGKRYSTANTNWAVSKKQKHGEVKTLTSAEIASLGY